jgi:hypothetical protein
MALIIENSEDEAKEYALDLARMIHLHAPMLTELRVGQNELGKAVTGAHTTIKTCLAHGVQDTDTVMEDCS